MASLVACTIDASAPYTQTRFQEIVGGQPVSEGAWLGVVWLDTGCTGLLVQDDLVVYAGHCGTDVSRVYWGNHVEVALEPAEGVTTKPLEGTTGVAVVECRAHPDAALTSGTDIAFCLLADRAPASAVIAPVRGCERDAVQPGGAAVLVGFGFDDEGYVGRKRATGAQIEHLASELRIGDALHGTCAGDSGGPALVALPDGSSGAGAFEWRALGILSSGLSSDDCGPGYYTDFAVVLDWLEEATQRRLTPCFEGGRWAPSPRCTYFPTSATGEVASDVPEMSRSCGAPGPRLNDESEPRVSIHNVEILGSSVRVDVSATDDDSGVHYVSLDMLDVDGALLATRRSEWPPFAVHAPWSRGTARVRVAAVDYAGLTAIEEASLPWRPESHAGIHADRSGCAVAPPRSSPLFSVALLVASLARKGSWPRRRGRG